MLVSSREVIFLAHQKIWCHKIRIDHTLLPYRGRIKVNDHVVHKILGIPIGEEHIDYAKNSFSDTYEEFYKFFNHENDQKAPSFTEAENWLLEKRKRSDTLWLWYWLEFAISSFLCPTSSTTLCVWAFHEIADPAKIRKYNWRRLVVERLFKGITEFNQGERKSGCLLFLMVWCIIFFLLTQCKLFVFANYIIWPPPRSPNQYICYLQILYLNALDTGDVVDQSAEVIVSVWTRSLVTQITGMDRGIWFWIWEVICKSSDHPPLPPLFSSFFSGSINLYVAQIATSLMDMYQLIHQHVASSLIIHIMFFAAQS